MSGKEIGRVQHSTTSRGVYTIERSGPSIVNTRSERDHRTLQLVQNIQWRLYLQEERHGAMAAKELRAHSGWKYT